MNAPLSPLVLSSKVERVRALLRQAQDEYAPAALASSFGVEDMLLTHFIAQEFPGISIFTLDTGRLPEETYRLIDVVQSHYDVRIDLYTPDSPALEQFVRQEGVNAFYRSVELRKACCNIRKVGPLRRALAGKKAWITGLRRTQAVTRGSLAEVEQDADHGLLKFSPLADWSEREVWEFARENHIPTNALHDLGYASIGCAPCTRAITKGEDVRAGRWWWESADTKECGLHPAKAGAVRQGNQT
jgi:phosphoadenosine phosphosulfate reductase